MERHLDDALNQLNEHLLRMATMTEDAIHQSVEALKHMDAAMAEKCIQYDQQIDGMENMIEEHAIECLALFQPMAKDLRFITTGMRINTEVERIADLVVNICQRVKELATLDQPPLKPLNDIPQLTDIAKWMVHNTIDAFVRRDEELARRVIIADQEANALRTAVVNELVHEYIAKDGSLVERAVPLILVTRDLERICDQAKFIAEDVIYMVNAKMVKHHPELLEDGGSAG